MRVSFVSPLTIGLSPLEASEVPYGDAPLGILTLASVARNGGHAVEVFDLDHLSHLVEPSRFLAETADRITASDSDVYGFGSICDSYPLTLRLAREVRRRRPGARILLGGPQATVTDREVLRAVPEIDVVVRGEAERILPPLLAAFAAGFNLAFVPGVTYRNLGELCRTADAPTILDLDEIPDPAWDLDPIIRERPDAGVEMGRGCPFACEFCSTNDFFRRKFRIRSPQRVLGQMLELEQRFGMRKFSLVHDMFTVDRRKVLEFAGEAERFGRGYEWGCSARTDCVDAELLERMYQGGCRKVFFGVESGSAQLQKSMKKQLDLEQARQVVECTAALGMRSTVSLIIGFPEEDQADLRDTADWYMYASRFDRTAVHLHLLSPLAATPITTRHFDSLVLDMTPDCWSGDTGERDEIAAHRELFVNFYSLPTQHPRTYLRELKHFLRCGTLRCNWLMQALHREGGHICDIIARFYDAKAGRTPQWYRSADFPASLLAFASSIAAGGEFPASRVMIDFYRQMLGMGGSGSAWAGPREFAYSDICVPALADGAVLVRCEGDAFGIIEALRAGAPLPAPSTEPNWIVVHTAVEAEGELHQVTPVAGQVLSWCDGRSTAAEIGRRAKVSGLAPGELADGVVAEILLGKLQAAGLVRYGLAGSQRDSIEPVKPMSEQRHSV